jgi:hypothetical protein
VTDLGLFVDFLFLPPGSVILPCWQEADVDQVIDDENKKWVDLSDLGMFIGYMFSPPGTVTFPSCP